MSVKPMHSNGPMCIFCKQSHLPNEVVVHLNCEEAKCTLLFHRTCMERKMSNAKNEDCQWNMKEINMIDKKNEKPEKTVDLQNKNCLFACFSIDLFNLGHGSPHISE